MLRGYRGFLGELARTGSASSLALQLRTGAAHVLRRLLRRPRPDGVALFLRNYSADGFELPDPERASLQLAAEACLVCGLCSAECARLGGRPPLDPRDAVIAAARLELDWNRLEPSARAAAGCAACRACEAVCPVSIPIHRVQELLAEPGAPTGAGVAALASGSGIG